MKTLATLAGPLALRFYFSNNADMANCFAGSSETFWRVIRNIILLVVVVGGFLCVDKPKQLGMSLRNVFPNDSLKTGTVGFCWH
jgi:hypothetical protein